MAEKEAIVYIVDVGKSMGTKNHGRKQSDLDWAMIYVWDTITNIVGTSPDGCSLLIANQARWLWTERLLYKLWLASKLMVRRWRYRQY